MLEEKPIIGITCASNEQAGYQYLGMRYIDAVERAGGCPIILPAAANLKTIARYTELCDGFIFSGGGDLDPAWWGAEPQPGLGEIDPRRDSFEVLMVREVLERDKPGLFICRGIQVLNVVCGGTLIQHIRSDLQHMQKAPRRHPTHSVKVHGEKGIAGLYPGTTIRVNSFHHQAADVLGAHLAVTATSADGIIEALVHDQKQFIVGVQWHPECLTDQFSRMLFRELVRQAGRRD